MKLLRTNTFWIILSLMFLGLILRLYAFSAITFGYDQARDALIAANLWNGDLKILGPTSDIHGLHHGALYWYLISPFYHFSQNNVYVVKLFMIFVGLFSIPLTYILAVKIFKKKSSALFAAFIIAVSYEVIQYSHWLSNPSFAFITIGLSFLFLWMYISEKFKYGLLFTAFFWGLSIQFEIFLLYQATVFFLILLVFKKLKVKDILLSGVVFLVTISPLIVAEIKFDFIALHGIASFFTGYSESRGQTLSEMASRATNMLFKIPYNNLFSSSGVSVALLSLMFIVGAVNTVLLKDKRLFFLLLWFFSPVVLFFVGSTNIYFVFIGCSIPISILFAYYAGQILSSQRKYIGFTILAALILGSNIYLLRDNDGKGESLFSVQTGMVYSSETQILDYVYEEANGKPFRINTVTNPLFINSTWSYLFDSYGRKTYGYMPFYWGYPQNGQFGEEIKYSDHFKQEDKYLFLIMEPSGGIPDFITRGIIAFENSRSKVLEVKKIGEFTVEKRLITKDKPFLKTEVDEGIKDVNFKYE